MNTPQANRCPVCTAPARLEGEGIAHQYYRIVCGRCGEWRTDGLVVQLGWGNYDAAARSRVSSWIRESRPAGVLSEEALRKAATVRRPGFWARAERLLLGMSRQASPSGHVRIEGPEWDAISWSTEPRETAQLLEGLIEAGYVRTDGRRPVYEVRPKGWIHLDSLEPRGAASSQGFVAMWFSEEVEQLWSQGIEPAIRAAGYDPYRVDRREFEGSVDDEIVAAIRRSRFVVADCTGQRNGVYYEAGFAQGLALPVYWTCRRDQLRDVHFDTSHLRFTIWDSERLPQFAEELRRRIEADIGHGPR